MVAVYRPDPEIIADNRWNPLWQNSWSLKTQLGSHWPPGLPKSTAVEVEYAYGADGRISVSARVPSIRYSRRIEIQRNAGRDLTDLDTWRGKLCKGSGTAS